MSALPELALQIGMGKACGGLQLSRATHYRQRRPRVRVEATRTPPLKLSEPEQIAVVGELMSERFVDLAPHQVYATLLDEGRYLCSIRTMYRLLASQQCVRERRDQRIHPIYARPELVAEAPGQVWSWDITKLKTTYMDSSSHAKLFLMGMDQRERIYGFVDGAVAPSLDGSYAPQLPIGESTHRASCCLSAFAPADRIRFHREDALS